MSLGLLHWLGLGPRAIPERSSLEAFERRMAKLRKRNRRIMLAMFLCLAITLFVTRAGVSPFSSNEAGGDPLTLSLTEVRIAFSAVLGPTDLRVADDHLLLIVNRTQAALRVGQDSAGNLRVRFDRTHVGLPDRDIATLERALEISLQGLLLDRGGGVVRATELAPDGLHLRVVPRR